MLHLRQRIEIKLNNKQKTVLQDFVLVGGNSQ